MDKRSKLSKKKDTGLGNEGIAGRYVKRDTPLVLRSEFSYVFERFFCSKSMKMCFVLFNTYSILIDLT